MTTLVNNYDESVELTTIDEAMEFFAENSANTTAQLTTVIRKLDREFHSWVKFTYSPQPRSDEQWASAEKEFLRENYGAMAGIEQAFGLNWPHKIDEAELA
jgi:hypothetical protein